MHEIKSLCEPHIYACLDREEAAICKLRMLVEEACKEFKIRCARVDTIELPRVDEKLLRGWNQADRSSDRLKCLLVGSRFAGPC